MGDALGPGADSGAAHGWRMVGVLVGPGVGERRDDVLARLLEGHDAREVLGRVGADVAPLSAASSFVQALSDAVCPERLRSRTASRFA
jgi:hypothetical protein